MGLFFRIQIGAELVAGDFPLHCDLQRNDSSWSDGCFIMQDLPDHRGMDAAGFSDFRHRAQFFDTFCDVFIHDKMSLERAMYKSQ